MAERAGHRCEYCLAPEQVFNFAFDVEHIVPRMAGGTDALDNLALACESCNTFKGATTEAHDALADRPVTLYNPRTDDWFIHFATDTRSATIVGRTP